MTQVNTVRGPVDGGRSGRTLMHEHIFVLSPEIEKTAEEWDEAAEQARAVDEAARAQGARDRHARRPHRHRAGPLHPAGRGDRRRRSPRSTSSWPPASTPTTTSRCTSTSRGRARSWGGPSRWWTSSSARSARGSARPGCGPGILKCASDRPGITPGRRARAAGRGAGPPGHRGADHHAHADAARALGARAAAHLQGGGRRPVPGRHRPQRRHRQHRLPPAA